MSYRVCYVGGNTKNKKLYEFHKWCDCEGCEIRGITKRHPPNALTFTTDDLKDREKIEKHLKNWTCKDGSRMLPIEYLGLKEKSHD